MIIEINKRLRYYDKETSRRQDDGAVRARPAEERMASDQHRKHRRGKRPDGARNPETEEHHHGLKGQRQ